MSSYSSNKHFWMCWVCMWPYWRVFDDGIFKFSGSLSVRMLFIQLNFKFFALSNNALAFRDGISDLLLSSLAFCALFLWLPNSRWLGLEFFICWTIKLIWGTLVQHFGWNFNAWGNVILVDLNDFLFGIFCTLNVTNMFWSSLHDMVLLLILIWPGLAFHLLRNQGFNGTIAHRL